MKLHNWRHIIFKLGIALLLVIACLPCEAQQKELVPQFGHTRKVQSIAFSPDGKTIATSSADQSIMLWDKSTSDILRVLVKNPRAARFGFTSIAYSKDGRLLAAVRENEIFLWEVATGKELRAFSGHEKLILSLAFNKDGTLLASGGSDKTIRVWRVDTGKQIACLNGHTSAVCAVEFDADGVTLRSGCRDHIFKTWSALDGKEISSVQCQGDAKRFGRPVILSRNGSIAATTDADNVYIYDIAAGSELRKIHSQSGFSKTLALSPNGKYLANCAHNAFQIWDTSSGKYLVAPPSSILNSHVLLAFSTDNQTLACEDSHGVITLWDVPSGKVVSTIHAHADKISYLKQSPDCNTLAINCNYKNTKLWDLETREQLHVLDSHGELSFSPNSKLFACVEETWVIKVWNSPTGDGLRYFAEEQMHSTPAVFSPDGKVLAVGGANKNIKNLLAVTIYRGAPDENVLTCFDVSNGKEIGSFAHEGDVNSLAFSPDGKVLASGGVNAIKLWTNSNGRLKKIRTFSGKVGALRQLLFSPDGKTLVSSGFNNKILFWEVNNDMKCSEFCDAPLVEAFSSDGKLLATRDKNSITIWNVDNRTVRCVLAGHNTVATSLAFSRDGKVAVTSSLDHTIRIWNTDNGAELGQLFSFGVDDWAVVAADGRYDGSEGGQKALVWRINDKIVKANQLRQNFLKSGLLQELLRIQP